MIDSRQRPGVDRWTGRAYLLLGFGGLLLAAAVALRNPVPVFPAIAFLVAPFAAAFGYPRELHRADLTWGELGTGADLEVQGTVTGQFGSAAADLSVRLASPPWVAVTKPIECRRERDRIRFSALWRVREPMIATMPPPRVVWSDPMRLCERNLPGDRPPLRIRRYPTELHGLTRIRLHRTHPLPGETPSMRLGTSGEFGGLRVATPDESIRRINWRATARTGRWIVNEYETELTGDLLVLLDRRPTTLGRGYDERLLRLGQAAAYGVAESILRGKIRIGFASFGEEVSGIPLATGRLHRTRILGAILACQPSPRGADPSRCTVGLRRLYRPGLTTLVISSWAGDPTLELSPYLHRAGYPLVTLSPSPVPLRAGTGGLSAAQESLAARIETLERRTRLATLWLDGPVIDWAGYWSLVPLVRALQGSGGRRAS